MMEYRRFKDKVVARLDPGEEVLDSIRKIASEENIQTGMINGLGATMDYDVSVYDLNEKKYYPVHCDVQSEITSLFGTITRKDGEVYLHVHMQAMDKNGKAIGGHLLKCVINATCELVIDVIDGSVGREVDEATGLTVMAF